MAAETISKKWKIFKRKLFAQRRRFFFHFSAKYRLTCLNYEIREYEFLEAFYVVK